jgi:hypothetical protein
MFSAAFPNLPKLCSKPMFTHKANGGNLKTSLETKAQFVFNFA